MAKPPSKHEKEAFVQSVFSSIVPRYDLLNSLMSLGRDAAWRRAAVREMGLTSGGAALDVCCGTGDLTFQMAQSVGETGRVVGTDFSLPMLEEAVRKAEARRCRQMRWCAAKADCLPFEDDMFDAAGVAFGLRNVADVGAALHEMRRVVKPGGRVVSLEILDVTSGFGRLPWRLYFHTLAPLLARLLGGRAAAYRYLSRSVAEFMPADDVAREFGDSGLRDVACRPFVFGGVCIHSGIK